MRRSITVAPAALVLILGLGQWAGNPRPLPDEPVGAAQLELASLPKPSSSPATPSITPSSIPVPPDTPPAGEAKPPKPAGAGGGGAKLSKQEYEGWRQYSVHCARCHGQDVLPNPVAANLLLSLGPGGAIDSFEKFAEIVSAGRAAGGMPAFKGVLTAEQIKAIYAYASGRAENRIPPGRPASPA
jgi:mono/diheme cytochrome c family protein